MGAGQLVEEQGGGDLGAEHGGEPLGGEAVQHAVVEDAGGVDDTGERRVLGQLREDGGQGFPVRGVAGGDDGFGAQCAQVRGEFGGAGGVGSAAAEQEQAAGPGPGEPPGGAGAEGAGATGDQDGAVGLPVVGRLGAYGGEAAAEDRAGADGELVLALGVGQDGGEPFGGAPVEGDGQVDGAAPALRVFEAATGRVRGRRPGGARPRSRRARRRRRRG